MILKKIIKSKKIISGILTVIVSACSICSSFALSLTSGFDGINMYSDLSNSARKCYYGDRTGASYVSNLNSALFYNFYNSFMYLNSSAQDDHVRLDSYANSVDFYAFSGHGLNLTAYNSSVKENALHFFARSGTNPSWHDSTMEQNDLVNGRTNEVRFGHNKLKWVTAYSCNWLTNDGDTTKQTNIYNMFEGTTLMMGFASVMYLDAREGTFYGDYISNRKYSFRYSFIEAAKKYQPQRKDGDSIARVEGYTASQNDTYSTYINTLPSNNWYKNNLGSYSIIQTYVIPHNGNPI